MIAPISGVSHTIWTIFPANDLRGGIGWLHVDMVEGSYLPFIVGLVASLLPTSPFFKFRIGLFTRFGPPVLLVTGIKCFLGVWYASSQSRWEIHKEMNTDAATLIKSTRRLGIRLATNQAIYLLWNVKYVDNVYLQCFFTTKNNQSAKQIFFIQPHESMFVQTKKMG